MNIYRSLDMVDDYEAIHGNREAVIRAISLMLAIMRDLGHLLPRIATQSIEVASRFREGRGDHSLLMGQEDLLNERLRDLVESSNGHSSEFHLVQTAHAILVLSRKPRWGGGAGEVLSNFINALDSAGLSYNPVIDLLDNYFPKPA